MNLFTVAVLGAFFTWLCAVAFAHETVAGEPVPLDDITPAIKQTSRWGLRLDGSFSPGGHRPTTSVRPLGFLSTPAETDPVEKLRKAAVQGDAQAQFNLGLCYECGRGVAKDLLEALKWFRQAADQGYGEAQYTLGCCYNGDDGFPQDPGEATKWWAKAAEQGYADAQYCLGLSYYMGQGVAKSPAEAVKWWAKAAEQDHANAQYFLGLSYYTGLGVPQHEKLALYWLRKAAGQGNENARVALKKLGEQSQIPDRK